MEYLILLACAVLLCSVFYFLTRRLPRRRASRTVSSASADAQAAQAASLTCTCEEWRKERARFRQGDPRRLCVHLCTRFAEDVLRLPETLRPFTQLVSLMAEEKRGVPHTPPTFAFVLGDSGYLATMEKGAYPLTTVYIGRNRYVFNVVEGSWGEGGTPPFASDIGSLIQAETRRRLAREKEKEHLRGDAAM